MNARLTVAVLLALVTGALAACGGQALNPTGGPAANLADPEVGGGVGSLNGSAPSTTREPSPRLDATTQALATFPTDVSLPVMTTIPTAEPASPTLLPTPTPGATTASTPASFEATPVATETQTPAPTSADPPSEIIHIVEAGENLFRIGLQYGVSWESIVEYNNIANPDQIEVGQEIRIPPTPTVTPTPSSEEGP